jgi:hypothetical protein
MKTIVFSLALFFANTLLAQNSSLRSKKNTKDTTMPNVLKGQNLGLQYKSNNGQGFDIFESGVDRMPVIMPDNANKTMLGLNAPLSQKPYQPFRKFQPEITIPNQGFKFQQDSLVVTPRKFNKN